MINIAIMGYGTVGSGVFEVIKRNQHIVNKKAREEINVKYVLDLREFPGLPVEKVLTHNIDDILNDDSVKVVVEVMGGVEPAYTFVKSALLKGKSVATSNKALVAAHGPELLQIAREKNVNFFFEASVGGGIPIIRPLNECLTADDILEISGILNGTTNFILTKMAKEGKEFGQVLKKAQELGYAEKDPTADIEGHDACRKIAILSSLAFGKTANFEEIYTEGITNITGKDMEYAKELECEIKLVGTSKKLSKGISAMVAPFMLSKNHPLSTVDGVFNAIFVKGNVLGDTMYYGSGAGSLPTASAVVSDVIDAVRHMGENVHIDWIDEKLEILELNDVPVKAFIRAGGDIKRIKTESKVLFEGCEFADLDYDDDEVAIITGQETEGSLKEKLEILRKAADIRNVIRMDV
mgnify:FL=1